MLRDSSMPKPRLAVHKFTSCDGCQLAFLNAGEMLLELSQLVTIVHFVEVGIDNQEAFADIAFIEGSITTPQEATRIKEIRKNSKLLISIGACATAGGIQALRNSNNYPQWLSSVYASPEYIDSLATSTPLSAHIRVDAEIWGCPVSTEQIMKTMASLLQGALPKTKHDAVCLECKRIGNVCVMVAKNEPCMGPVTQTGCHALCPSLARGCYACYGPSENANTKSLGRWFLQQQQTKKQVIQHYNHINGAAPVFKEAVHYFKGIKIVRE